MARAGKRGKTNRGENCGMYPPSSRKKRVIDPEGGEFAGELRMNYLRK